ncbi:NmrA family NAD(P)-binding protein [Mycobacterium sp. NPDC003449]
MSVLVIGATGTTGRYVCQALAAAGAGVTAATRSGAAPAGSRGVRFDWYDPATYRDALDGADRMYVIAPSQESEPDAAMRPFLDEARAAGVKRVVLLSSSLIAAGGPGVGRVHATVAQTFGEWAVLRPSWFMQNFSGRHPHADAIRDRRVVTTATGSGRVGFIDARDIGRVAARVLLDDVPLNSDPILTGPQALSYDDVAAVIGRVCGRAVTHARVSRDEMRAIFAADGLPGGYAEMLAGLDALIASGAEDRVTDAVTRLTGHEPRSFAEFWSSQERRATH